MNADLTCDVLLFFATSTEGKSLKNAARRLAIAFQKTKSGRLGDHFSMGIVGRSRVIAVRTEMGPFGHAGSAAKGLLFQSATQATGIVQMGMAFGVDPSRQQLGDVAVSTCLIPYDRRLVRDEGANYVVDYSQANRWPANQALLQQFMRESMREESARSYHVHFGALLSGAAQIRSRQFREELVRLAPEGPDPVVAGEMEAAGLLSIRPKDDPIWLVVKGISDFADHERDNIIKVWRSKASDNAADFVLSALLNDQTAEYN